MTVGDLIERLGSYPVSTPIMRVVEGDPVTYGVDPVILGDVEFVCVEGTIPLSARGYYQRHLEPGSTSAVLIR